ncbi:MAG: hypothetical protein M1830_010799 [Pleopsidium flavum]|nr:MAG: hypothetical protein M1830_010799 [Pleopsidium flavum]
MDVAYDHIQEEVLSPDEAAEKEAAQNGQGNLNTEFREAYNSFSASPWGARLGGFFGNVKKQGESYYEGARQEASAASGEALKGFTELKSTIINRTRSLSLNTSPETSGTAPGAPAEGPQDQAAKDRSDSEALRESEGIISRFRTEAAKRLKDIEKAEDAADEALLKFGTNIRNFFRDAVTIAPPTEEKDRDGNSKVLFESKDSDGKRVIHTTRFDAQLHAIHSSLDSFTKDPMSPEYGKWKEDFSVEKKTEEISTDLEKYEELRRAMEKLVPEKVEYGEFWKRYYFLRMVVETEDQRRRDLLKGAATGDEEEVGWDEDSEDETSTPDASAKPSATITTSNVTLADSSTTINPAPGSTEPKDTPSADSLKPNEPRRSNDQNSQPDSDASYDLISGATSRAPGSPKEEKEKEKEKEKRKKDVVAEESDEEDWE